MEKMARWQSQGTRAPSRDREGETLNWLGNVRLGMLF